MLPAVQEQVISRAGNRCEYCKMHQALQGATFHVEHVIPRSVGGADSADNLAWACPSCNLHKADRTSIQLDRLSDTTPLFHPRMDQWTDHFEWDDYTIVGTTNIGRATVLALDLNHERRIKIRQAEQLFELFPPGSQ